MTHNSDTSDWRRWGSANVSDAMRKCGKYFQAMDAGIRPVASDMAAAGPAFTVRCYSGATWAMEKSLELAQPGNVLVVDGGHARKSAIKNRKSQIKNCGAAACGWKPPLRLDPARSTNSQSET